MCNFSCCLDGCRYVNDIIILRKTQAPLHCAQEICIFLINKFQFEYEIDFVYKKMINQSKETLLLFFRFD